MDKSTITLLLGITFGLSVVTLVLVLVARAQNTMALAPLQMQTYQNEEKWDVVKDANGRVRNVVVHREAKTT